MASVNTKALWNRRCARASWSQGQTVPSVPGWRRNQIL